MSSDRPGSFAVHAACIRGVEAQPVTVEVSYGGSIPGITIVGMADSSVLEARVRIRCALVACGFDVRDHRELIAWRFEEDRFWIRPAHRRCNTRHVGADTAYGPR